MFNPDQTDTDADGLGLNPVVPREVAPVVTAALGGEEQSFQLPTRFRDVAKEKPIDMEGHGVNLHLQWCWWKTPEQASG